VEFFQWDEKYSVSVPSVDRQHKVLVDYINKLQTEITRSDPDRMKIELVINGLVSYTNSHFKYEEMLFSMYAYPKPESTKHKEIHKRLFDDVAVYKQRFDNDDSTVGPELLAFLKRWLNDHILVEDMAYSGHMIARNVS